MGRQVNSLKRQAGKAKRYEELKTELDIQLRTALAGRYFVLEREAPGLAGNWRPLSGSGRNSSRRWKPKTAS